MSLRHALHDPLWQDEVASARIIAQPNVADVLHRVQQTESTPPLWYVAAWAAHRLGVGIVDVRLLSMLAMGVAVALVVVFARRMLPLGAAALAGLLVAVGAQFAADSHELRAYALLVCVTVLCAMALDAEAHSPSVGREAALAACVAVGLSTHYFFAFSLLAAVAWLVIEREARHVRIRALAAVAAGIAAFAPLAPLALRQIGHDRYWWIGPFVFRAVVNTPFRLFSPLTSRTVGEIVPALLLAAVIAGAHLLARISHRGRLAAALALGPLVAAGAAWWAGMRIFAPRNLVAAGPFLAIALAALVAAAPRRLAVVFGTLLAAAALGGYAWSQRGAATPFDRIARALASEGWHPNDPIAVANFFAFRSPLEWYLPAQPPLALAHPLPRACHRLFVVWVGRPHRGIRAAVVGRFTVERVVNTTSITRILSAGGVRILTDPLNPSPCARAVTKGMFSARYGLPQLG